jgi:hypothetical protein
MRICLSSVRAARRVRTDRRTERPSDHLCTNEKSLVHFLFHMYIYAIRRVRDGDDARIRCGDRRHRRERRDETVVIIEGAVARRERDRLEWEEDNHQQDVG